MGPSIIFKTASFGSSMHLSTMGIRNSWWVSTVLSFYLSTVNRNHPRSFVNSTINVSQSFGFVGSLAFMKRILDGLGSILIYWASKWPYIVRCWLDPVLYKAYATLIAAPHGPNPNRFAYRCFDTVYSISWNIKLLSPIEWHSISILSFHIFLFLSVFPIFLPILMYFYGACSPVRLPLSVSTSWLPMSLYGHFFVAVLLYTVAVCSQRRLSNVCEKKSAPERHWWVNSITKMGLSVVILVSCNQMDSKLINFESHFGLEPHFSCSHGH